MAAGLSELRTRSAAVLAKERAVLLAAPVVAVLLAWASVDGGYPATYWYPGALVVLVLLGAALAGRLGGDPPAPRRAAWIALAFLAGFAVWSFCSIAWAEVKADAWDGSNRTLLYLSLYALFLLLPWTLRGAHVVLGTYAFGVAGIAGWTLWRGSTSADPLELFGGGTRFSSPIGYHNASAALFTFAAVVLVHLMARAGTPILLRAAAASGAVVLTVASLLPQSRGWLLALVPTVLLFLALVPGRARSAIALLTVGAAVAPLVQRTLDVNSAAEMGHPGPALDAVGRATVPAAAGAAAVVVLWAIAERRYAPSAATARLADRAVVAAVAGGLVLAAALVLALGSPREWASRGWKDFTQVEEPAQPTPGSHLTSGVGGTRYDVWRVAVGAFRRKPLTGVGADNFAVDYFRERRVLEEPRYPHSIELRALVQTGVVGAVLFAGFLVAVFAAAGGGRRDASTGLRATVVVGAAYWLVHGSIDWFWEIPAVTAPVVAALGLAAALRAGPAVEPARTRRRTFLVLAAVAAVAVAVSYALPLLSALYVRDAVRSWRADAPAAFAALDRAGRLNPVSDEPDLVAGGIASRLDRYERMRDTFAAAVARNPHSWYGFLELGIADSLTGRRSQALVHLARAAELNPLEPVIPAVARRIRGGARVDPADVDDVFVRRAAGLLPRPGAIGSPR